MLDQLTPVMRQYKAIKKEYKDAIVLFRMGDFYEMFFEDAIIASKVLNIALTSRDKKTNNPVPMCGVPYHSIENYLSILVKNGFNVAICEQMEDPKKAKGLVERAVIRLITPGTVNDPSLLQAREHNYLLAVCWTNQIIGLSFVDVSTAEFSLTEFSGEKFEELFLQELNRLEPKEILLPESCETDSLTSKLKSIYRVNFLPDWVFSFDESYQRLTYHFKTQSLRGFGCEEMVQGIRAAGANLYYLIETQKNQLSHINKLSPYFSGEYMILDRATQKNLELIKSIRDNSVQGSLLGLMDRTVTSMGGRMLKKWLLFPLLDVEKINERLDAVEELKEKFSIRKELRQLLKEIADLQRLSSKVSLGTANPRDLIALKNSAALIPLIRENLKSFNSKLLVSLISQCDDLNDLYILIDSSIENSPPLVIREGGIIKDGYSSELDELRKISREGKSFIALMEEEERKRTGISNLRIRYNKVFGYFIEVTRSQLDLVPSDYIRKQTLVNAERFITPKLKDYEEKVLHAEERMTELEYELLVAIREKVAELIPRIQSTATAIAQIDVLAALAELAAERNYCRPVVNNSEEIIIKDGRHPVLETSQFITSFIPNDTKINCCEDQILLITGPNMAGKSTYIRQVALITLMAQMGSFVPASEAIIGVVDRIFTRVGASDNLYGGESTFMVEMHEAANILNNATDRSLIVLDEIGRGTSTFDGLSIAWATVEHLHGKNEKGPKTLFATHYHELTDISITHPRVKNYSVAIAEQGSNIIFLRKLVPGKADKSYGIQVARLAGLPQSVIERAKEILENLEQQEFDPEGKPSISRKSRRKKPIENERFIQMGLFDHLEQSLKKEIEQIDLDKITPIEALNILYHLKTKIRKDEL